MKLRRWVFNLYLVGVIGLLAVSCKTAEERERDKAATHLSVYVESQAYPDGRNQTAQVYRKDPVTVYVDRTPFLNTGNVEQAAVVDDWGGFHVQIKLDRRGTLLLESVSASKVGKRLVIRCEWTESRWLAAPLIHSRISDGIIRFVPDASREESERIVLGLNNVAEKLRKKEKPLLKNVWDKTDD